MLPYIPDVVPNIVVALVIVVAFVMAFAPALRKCPVAFYAVWIAACMATFVDIVRWIPWLYYVVQAFASCYTGVAFYLLVMFAGAFPKKWWFTKRLLSVRTEMSIIGGFIIFAHVIQVLIMVPLSFTPIWDKAWGGGLTSIIMFIAASVVGVPLTVCFFCAVDYFVSHGAWHYGAFDVEKGAKARLSVYGAYGAPGHFAFDWPCRICATWWRWICGLCSERVGLCCDWRRLCGAEAAPASRETR